MLRNVAGKDDKGNHLVGFITLRSTKSTIFQVLPCDIGYNSQSTWNSKRNAHIDQVFEELPCCICRFQVILTINIFFVAWKNATNIETTKYYPESFKYKHA